MPLKRDVHKLQEDVVKVLADVRDLMGRASETFKADALGDRCTKFMGEVKNELEKVQNLELRMAIVAPMKAGKSTIINAIVGQDLLPSRNAAMTTLPTEIAFKADVIEPFLDLPFETFCDFEESYESLQLTLEERGMEWVKDQLAEYPHLDPLIQKIQKREKLAVQAKVEGHQDIVETLMTLNDIVRLSAVLEKKNLLSKLEKVPRIKTSFWQAQVPEESGQLGNLVIVDTPGPNEAGGNFKLAEVVKQQLEKSSIVLVVLDFTQLNTEAADKIKKDVQKVIDVSGKDQLYVLVNKVDQRSEGDMSSSDVEKFVAAQFGIGRDNTKRVFEVSARQAFSAANLIQELTRNPGITVDALKTAKTFARLAHGLRWERELNKAIKKNDIESLRVDALEFWEESGFDSFLREAINALIERAAPECLNAALGRCQQCLGQLKEEAETRSQGITKKVEDLQRQIDGLEADLKQIELCRTRAGSVSRIKATLHQELREIVSSLQNKAKISLEIYWDQQEYQQSDFIGKRGIEARNFVNWFGKRFGVEIEKGRRYQEFQTESKAEEFSSQAINFARQRVDGLIEQTRDKTRQRIEAACQKLIKQLEAETKPIIEKAHRRLNESFDINFTPPTFSLSTDELKISRPRIKSDHRYVDQGYETKKVEKRSFWHWCWLVPYTETKKIKRPAKREDYYTVSLEELIEEANHSIKLRIETIAKNISEYVDEDFQREIDAFFDNLESYLSRYKQSLEQSMKDKKRSQADQDNLSENLAEFISEADSQIEKAKENIKRTKEFLEKNK